MEFRKLRKGNSPVGGQKNASALAVAVFGPDPPPNKSAAPTEAPCELE